MIHLSVLTLISNIHFCSNVVFHKIQSRGKNKDLRSNRSRQYFVLQSHPQNGKCRAQREYFHSKTGSLTYTTHTHTRLAHKIERRANPKRTRMAPFVLCTLNASVMPPMPTKREPPYAECTALVNRQGMKACRGCWYVRPKIPSVQNTAIISQP
jgi:hypothetical protein